MEHNYNLSINKSCQEINTYLDEKFKLHLSTFQKESEKIKDDITNNLRTELIKNMTGEQHFTPNYKKDYFENFLKLIDNKNINYEKIKEVLDDDEYIIGFNGIIGIKYILPHNYLYKSIFDHSHKSEIVKNHPLKHTLEHNYQCINHESPCKCHTGLLCGYDYSFKYKYNINGRQKRQYIKKCNFFEKKEFNYNCVNCKTFKQANNSLILASKKNREELYNTFPVEQNFITNKLNKIVIKLEDEKKNIMNYKLIPYLPYSNGSNYPRHTDLTNINYNIYKFNNNFLLNDTYIDLISNIFNNMLMIYQTCREDICNNQIRKTMFINYKINVFEYEKNNILNYYDSFYYKDKLGVQVSNIININSCLNKKNQFYKLKNNIINTKKIIFNSLENYILCNWKGKYLTIPEAIQIKNENKRLLELNEKTTKDLVKNKLILEELQKYSSLDDKLIKCNNLNEEYTNKMILLEEREKNILRKENELIKKKLQIQKSINEKENELVKKELQIQESIGEKESELVIKLALADDYQDILNKNISKYETKNNKLKESKAKLGFLIKSYKKNKQKLENDKINFEKYKKNFIDDTNIILSDSEDTESDYI